MICGRQYVLERHPSEIKKHFSCHGALVCRASDFCCGDDFQKQRFCLDSEDISSALQYSSERQCPQSQYCTAVGETLQRNSVCRKKETSIKRAFTYNSWGYQTIAPGFCHKSSAISKQKYRCIKNVQSCGAPNIAWGLKFSSSQNGYGSSNKRSRHCISKNSLWRSAERSG
jgi:hypothetical protein